MIVCLGFKNAFLDEDVSTLVLRTLYQIAMVHMDLWDREGHTVEQLDALDKAIAKLYSDFVLAFKDVNPSQCRFPKLHYLLHLTSVIQEFGSMRAVDSCYGEVGHELGVTCATVGHTYPQ